MPFNLRWRPISATQDVPVDEFHPLPVMASLPGATISYAFVTLTVAAVSIGIPVPLTPGVVPLVAVLTLETADIRFRVDGGAPTSTVGMLMYAGDSLTLNTQEEIANFRAIRTGGTSGTLSITLER